MSIESSECMIALRTKGRGYEVLGSGLYRGIVAEQVQFGTSNPGGPDSFSCLLRRDPGVYYADLSGLNKLYAEIGGTASWSGRVKATPTTYGDEQYISLIGEGMYGSMSDDQYDKTYVIQDMTPFQDMRGFPSATLGSGFACANAQVNTGAAGITLAFPASTTAYTINSYCCAVLDLGPNNVATNVYVEYESSNNAGVATSLYVRIGDRPDLQSAINTQASVLNNASAAGTLTVSNSAGLGRYVSLFNYMNAGATFAVDVWFKITKVIVTTSSTYASNFASATALPAITSRGSSVLAASLGIKDILTSKCPSISSDQTGIQSTSFFIPQYTSGGRKTPMDMVNDLNSYHAWQFLLTPDMTPKPIYRAVPTVPTWIAGKGDAIKLEDAGANDTSEIFNQVICQFQMADGINREVVAKSKPYYSAVMADVPGFYMPMDNATRVTDYSGYDNPGIPTATPTLSAVAMPNGEAGGMTFNGTTQYLTTYNSVNVGTAIANPQLHPGDVVTFECWYKRAGVSGVGYRTMWDSGSGDLYVAFDPADKIYIGKSAIGQNWLSTATYTDTTNWHHFVVVKNAGTTTVYIDGAAISGATTAQTLVAATANPLVGAQVGASNFFNGSIAHAALYPTALSATRVLAHYNAASLSTNQTIPDREGITKSKTLKMTGKSNPAAAWQIAQAYYNTHKTAPAKGTVTLTGTARKTVGGRAPVGSIQAGDAMLIENVHNPDTLQQGRVVVIQKTNYTHDNLQNSLTIDSRRDYLDALLERLGVVTR